MGVKVPDMIGRKGTGEFPIVKDLDLEGGFQVCASSLDEIKYKKIGMYASHNGLLYRWSGSAWVNQDVLQMVAGRQIITAAEYCVIGVVRAIVTATTNLTLQAICRTSVTDASGSIRVYDVTNGEQIIGPTSITYNSGNYTYVDSSDVSGHTGTIFYELQMKLDSASSGYAIICDNAVLILAE